MDLSVTTKRKRQVVDLTDQVQMHIPSGVSGLAVITALHTTAALTTADLDPGTDLDLLDALEGLIAGRAWRHPHNPAHTADHILASLIGPSVSLPVSRGKLILGTWQRLVLIELDGPRSRQLRLTLVEVY